MIKTAITGPWRFAVYLLILTGYVVLGYFTEREQTARLLLVYSGLFIFYGEFIVHFKTRQLIREGITLAIILRLIMVFCVPALSDDFNRFMWDGTLINNGVNPYQYTPDEIMRFQQGGMQLKGISSELFAHLNSKNYYSVYPPVSQAIYSATTFISSGNIYLNIILMKLMIVLFELGTIYCLWKIILFLNIKPERILVYALNPLIIIELTGNIHFEAGMIFFLALAFYLILRQKYILSALIFGLAISIKLLPLIFLPLLFRYIGFKRTVIYSILAGAITTLCFLPFLNDTMISHISTSINLYFNEFEYNASFYYLGKLIGGWNDLDVKLFLQKIMPVITLAAILVLALKYKKNDFFTACLFVAFIYFSLTTTVHPWYIALLVMFTTITSHYFVIYWSAMIVVTYNTYHTPENIEDFKFIIFEYLSVFSIFIFEFISRRNKINQAQPL